jgi:hypothetical protein
MNFRYHKKILLCNELENFSELMMIHERKISDFLEIPTVKEKYFQIALYLSKVWGLGRRFRDECQIWGFKDYFWEKGFTLFLNGQI